MRTTLEHLYYRKKKTYSKLTLRYQKSVREGRFEKFTYRQQSRLLSRIRKLGESLRKLSLQLQMSAIGLSALFLSTAIESKAQTGLGPFNQITDREQNPLRPPLPMPENYVYPTFADFDGDGDQDLYITWDSNTFSFGEQVDTVLVFDNRFSDNGNRLFVESGPSSANPIPNGVRDSNFFGYEHKLVYVDIDNDGDLDAFTPAFDGSFTSSVFFFYNDGSANWEGNRYSTYSDPENPFYNTYQTNNFISTGGMTFVDLDNDGDLDCLMRDEFFHNIGTPTNPNFTEVLTGFDLPGVVDYTTFFDIDGDGDQDMIASNGSLIKFYRNDNALPPSPSDPTTLDNFVDANDPRLPFDDQSFNDAAFPNFVDTDNDGDLDMVIYGRGDPYYEFFFFENTGNYTFVERTGLENPFGGIDIGENATPAIVDIDIDGDQDIFIGSRNAGITFYQNNNNTTFQRNDASNQLSFFSLNYPSPGYDSTVVEFGDFDQDGDFDGAFVGTRFDNQFFYFQNNGGTLETTQSVTDLVTEIETLSASNGGNREIHAALGDVDGDGDLDAVVGGIGIFGPPLRYFENTGGNTFNPGVSIFGFGDTNPDLADVNHDGLEDLVIGQNTGNVRFFLSGGDIATMNEQTGANNPLENPINLASDNGFDATPEFGDLDGDGDLDYIQGRRNGQVIYVRNDNQPPTLSITLDPSIIFTEQGPAVTLTPSSITPGDPDPTGNTFWIEVVLRITNPSVGDLLTEPAALPAGITPVWDPVNYELSLSGHLDRDTYVNLIQDITFSSTSNNPGPNKVIEYWITDDDATTPQNAAASISLPIIESNDAPVISLPNPSFVFTENDPPVPITSNMTITDPDNPDLFQATIAFSANYIQGEDILAFTDQNGITGSFDSATGIMTLSGLSSVINYQTAIESITYQNTSEDPDTNNRTIGITVSDGSLSSNTPTITATIISVNDAPTITGSGTDKNYSLAELNFLIDDQIQVTDPDDVNVTGGSVVVSTNFQSGVDILSLGSTNGITGTFDDQTGVLTLSGTASLSDYTDAFRSVTYFNQSDGSQSPKTVQFFATDPNGATSSPYSININLGAPSVDANPVNTNATIGQTTTIDVVSAATVDPADIITTSIITGPTQGSATVNTNTQEIDYTPLSNASGTDQIEFELCNQNSVCDRDFVNITIVNNPPVIDQPNAKAPPGGSTTIDLTTIVSDDEGNVDPNSIQIITQPESGAVASIDGFNLIVDYDGLTFTGTDRLTIEVCDLSGECTQTEIEIRVGNVDGVTVYNALSPNGDGLQDYTRIEDIEFFPENSMVVYNRMGNRVWGGTNYNNTTVIFEGLDDDGNELPNGTYYYTIELINSDGEKKRESGYIVLNR